MTAAASGHNWEQQVQSQLKQMQSGSSSGCNQGAAVDAITAEADAIKDAIGEQLPVTGLLTWGTNSVLVSK